MEEKIDKIPMFLPLCIFDVKIFEIFFFFLLTGDAITLAVPTLCTGICSAPNMRAFLWSLFVSFATGCFILGS